MTVQLSTSSTPKISNGGNAGMNLITTSSGSSPCPDHIVIVGGGRWSRVFVDVLCGLVPPEVEISVHTRQGQKVMTEWVSARGLDKRIVISSDPPNDAPAGTCAAIVVNAAKDHVDAAARMIDA